jgi:hypothetical protein
LTVCEFVSFVLLFCILLCFFVKEFLNVSLLFGSVVNAFCDDSCFFVKSFKLGGDPSETGASLCLYGFAASDEQQGN